MTCVVSLYVKSFHLQVEKIPNSENNLKCRNLYSKSQAQGLEENSKTETQYNIQLNQSES